MENNEQQIETDKTLKKKLSREDLLAGKCSTDEDENKVVDPRFKSPDEILLQMLAQRRTDSPEVTIQHGYQRGETTIGLDHTVNRKPNPDTLKNDFRDLTNRYEKDKERWKEYERRIHDWKEQVMNVLQNLHQQANSNESLKKEIETLKELNRQKDDEIRSLADEIRKTITIKK